MNRVFKVGLASTVLGGAGLAAGWAADPARTAHSYVFAFAAVFSLVMGALFLLMIGHASDATWFVAVRRQCEQVTGVLPVLAVLFVPVLLSLGRIYSWTHVADLPTVVREHVERKRAWLSSPFFVVRSCAYFAIILITSELLLWWSHVQDRSGDRSGRLARRMTALSAGGLPVISLALTFASFDWFMSLEPAWYSDIYGVYVFAGGFTAGLALVSLLIVGARGGGVLPEGVSKEHYHALGRLQLAMLIFWAYIEWAQLLLMWIADLPLEVTFYIARWHGGWQWVGLALLLLHFVLPFFVLLQRSVKLRGDTLSAISAWLLAAHFLDAYYLIIPAFSPGRFALGYTDFAACFAVAGACAVAGALRAKRSRHYPAGDPRLADSLRYEAA